MDYTDISVCCPHCGKEINLEKVFELLQEACSLYREKLYYICQLDSDYELLEYIKLYKETYKAFPISKLRWVPDKETEIQKRLDRTYCKVSVVTNEIYDKLQNIEQQLVHR